MDASYISSRTNPFVVWLGKLSDKKEREASGRYIAEGFKLCREACGHAVVEYAVLREDRANDAAYTALADASGGKTVVLSAGAFAKVSGDRSPDGILFVAQKGDHSIPADMTGERICILCGLQDPGNVGTILRTAAALGTDRVILSDCADLHSPKVIRSSMGAFFKIRISLCADLPALISRLQGAGRRVIAAALSEHGKTLGEAALQPTDCLILGNEGHGVPAEIIRLCDTTLRIPMTDKTESLNAAAAAAVLLWEYSKV